MDSFSEKKSGNRNSIPEKYKPAVPVYLLIQGDFLTAF